MSPSDLIHIHLSRVLPAEKWRVVRLLTRVKDFPDFVPSVKEASVLARHHHVSRTRWKVQINGVPVSWVEDDVLSLKDQAIYFKLTEGDLEEFGGSWKFSDSSEGTQVDVDVNLRVGIPGFKDFADAYIEKLLTQNFEMIFDAVEKRLISTRYTGYRVGLKQKIAGFGIVGHLYNYNHLEKALKALRPDFKIPSREFLSQLYHITPSFKLCDVKEFKSKTGQTTHGCVVVATFIPDMIDKDVWTVFSKVVRACKVAEKAGVGIVTLGGFTSIVAERIGHEVASEVNVPVTTGNTFTAAMTIDGVLKAAQMMGYQLNRLHVAIVGGTGDIGSACARALALKVKHLTITGRTKEHLHKLAAELTHLRKGRIVATTDNKAGVRGADIVIACTSASAAILDVKWFKPGAIVCDVGYPKNVSYLPMTREDILVFSGGLAQSPSPLPFPIDVGLPAPDVLFGCFSESIILALENRFENYSFGRGYITPEKMDEIRSLGAKHGFVPAPFYWGNQLIDADLIERIKKNSRR